MGVPEPTDQQADDGVDALDEAEVDEMIERVRRWLFEGGPDPSPP